MGLAAAIIEITIGRESYLNSLDLNVNRIPHIVASLLPPGS